MKRSAALLFAIIGVVLMILGIIPLTMRLSMGWFLVGLGAGFLLCIPVSYIIKANAPRVYGVVRVIVSWLLVSGAVLLALVLGLIIYRGTKEDAPPNAVIVVLGAGLTRDRLTPSVLSTMRLNVAKNLLNERPWAVCIVSGGQGQVELVSEAQAMKTYLIEQGIAESRIIMEDQSVSTEQNLTFSAQIMDEMGLLEACGGNIALVTTNYHGFRACHFAEAAGLIPFPQPAPVHPAFMPVYALREALAIVMQVWLGS